MSILKNILLNVDSYKVSMFAQYPERTEIVHSYIESRGGEHLETLFFGLQGFIKDYLLKPVTMADIDLAEEIMQAHGEPFNRAGWEYIVTNHGGKLPVHIRAVPEGTVVPVSNVLLTIENTDPNCFWLTTHLETALLRAIWYPTTVATNSKAIKNLIKGFLEKNGDPAGLGFKLHDFGARGVSSQESAGIGGAAHLINFMGTDTIAGILWAREHYNAGVAGFSIPAAEHSTITSWGRPYEVKAYENMLNKFAKPGAILAVVSDSYDVFNAAENLWGSELRQKVLDSGATLVIRPDSGDPVRVNSRLIQILDKKFGSTVNDKGYRVLNNVRLIQGDGVNYNTIQDILTVFDNNGYSADNIAFGMGGALLQHVNRDTQKFAMKCSAIRVGKHDWRKVLKDPITDSGKKSKAGLLELWRKDNKFATSETAPELLNGWDRGLETVYLNGELIRDMTFEEIRNNSNL
jgi:nicotinamide phosphoribosyltransferase